MVEFLSLYGKTGQLLPLLFTKNKCKIRAPWPMKGLQSLNPHLKGPAHISANHIQNCTQGKWDANARSSSHVME